jgi:cephalosporin hydroxylase
MSMKCERHMLQDPVELQAFINILKQENVRSYLEIGSKHGGSLWHVALALPKGSRIVSVDLPHGDGSFKDSEPNLKQCCVALMRKGYDVRVVLGNSIEPKTVEEVRAHGPFDACFIDANHTEPYVRADWANYGPMARIVAFHDIGWVTGDRQMGKKMPIQVPEVWAEIKNGYRWQEFKFHHTKRDNGIGVLWRS